MKGFKYFRDMLGRKRELKGICSNMEKITNRFNYTDERISEIEAESTAMIQRERKK